MSTWLRLALAALLLDVALTAFSQPAPAGAPRIHVAQGGWGGTEAAEIAAVLVAVAHEFPPPMTAGERPFPIRIRHRFGGPTIDYQRDRDDAIVIHLSARDSRWYQFVYQFAHEYCHVLARFDRKQVGEDIVREHQWFEESLCEAASLFALRRLAAKGREDPSDPVLREMAPQLERYVRQLLAAPHRCLPAGTTLAAWYERHGATLRAQPYQRELNELVAVQILPLFERSPKHWSALAHLNATPPSPGRSFADFLVAWSAASPPELQPLVADVRGLFGMLEGARTPSPPPPGPGPGCGS